ncbi:MAG: response regulator [Gammaproteobacteria bacterium]|nr:response regulator [Gammaproteobacteria bacterium]
MAGKVYIVDDDAAVRTAVSLLIRSCGWEPVACSSAAELFALIGDHWPTCILLDLEMPDMDGVSVQQELRRRGVHVPVIVITTLGDHPLVDRAHANGAHSVISKPFGPLDLMDVIAGVIGPLA